VHVAAVAEWAGEAELGAVGLGGAVGGDAVVVPVVADRAQQGVEPGVDEQPVSV
jgi:hypothetical protein